MRRPLREKASSNITRGLERLHKGCAPPSTFRQLSQTRNPSRAGPSQPSRDPCQVDVSSESSQERIQCFPRNPSKAARGTERQGGHLSPTYSALLYRQIQIACSAHSSAPSGAGREPCTAAGKDRLDVTTDAHRLFQLGALDTGLGFQRWVPVSREMRSLGHQDQRF